MVTWFISKFFQHRHKKLMEQYHERRAHVRRAVSMQPRPTA
jgi:hypothetical protein